MLVSKIYLQKVPVAGFLWKVVLYYQIIDYHRKQSGNMLHRHSSERSGLMKTKHISVFIHGMGTHCRTPCAVISTG